MSGIRVNEELLKAIANRDRRAILEALRKKKTSSYAELMKANGFVLGQSGRFSYHLRKLIKAGLVRKLPDGRYALTNIGMRVVDILLEEERPYSIRDSIEGFLEETNEVRFL